MTKPSQKVRKVKAWVVNFDDGFNNGLWNSEWFSIYSDAELKVMKLNKQHRRLCVLDCQNPFSVIPCLITILPHGK